MTLRLRSGLHVSRRDDAHLQVGLDPPTRVVVPDDPEVRRLLDRLVGGTTSLGPPEAPSACSPGPAHRALARLIEAGLVEEAPADVIDGDGPPRVALQAAGDGASDLTERLGRLLRADGVSVAVGHDRDTEPDRDAGRAGHRGLPGLPRLAVLVATGEPRREAADAHLRDGRPHLVLAGGPGRVVVGPLVSPGLTACLRCLDAHRSESDPRRSLVLAQLEGRAGGPADTALTALAAAWAARDVRTFLAGGRPSTWSATVAVGADLLPHREEWRRHPWCGCAWDVLGRPEDQRDTG